MLNKENAHFLYIRPLKFGISFELHYFCTQKTESSAVGSALRSGRRGRAFESPLSDQRRQSVAFVFLTISLLVDFRVIINRGLEAPIYYIIIVATCTIRSWRCSEYGGRG